MKTKKLKRREEKFKSSKGWRDRDKNKGREKKQNNFRREEGRKKELTNYKGRENYNR